MNVVTHQPLTADLITDAPHMLQGSFFKKTAISCEPILYKAYRFILKNDTINPSGD